MTTIYLDTSHLSVLAKAHAAGDPAFAEFESAWRAAGGELVFTRTHVVELRQHGDPNVRAARYSLLELLLPIRSDVVTREPVAERPVLLQSREVLRALEAQGVFRVQSEDPGVAAEWRRRHLEVLPENWNAPTDVAAARTFEDAIFGNIVLYMQSAMRTEADAQRRPRSEPYERTKVRDLRKEPVSAPETQKALEAFEQVAVSDAEIAALFPFLPLPVARDLVARSREPLRRMIVRAGEVGIQQAYLEALGLTGVPGDKRYLDDVSDELVFQHHVRSAIEILNASADVAAQVAQRVSMEDCPGYWLARAVQLEIRRAEPEPEPSNAYDLDHVMYAPYVDAFFTDKRIAGYVNAVRKRPDTIASIAALPPAVATAARVEAIAEAVRAVGPKSTGR